jgi:excisionase family DNA binding protein
MITKRSKRNRATLTVEEAAEQIGVSRATAYLAIRRGEIPAFQIGKRFFIPKKAFDRLLQLLEPVVSKTTI